MGNSGGDEIAAGVLVGDALAEADVRTLIRLIADCAVVSGGVMAQKRCLMEGLARALDADHWMWNVTRITDDGGLTAVSLLHNLSEGQLALIAEENYSAPDNPCNVAMVELSREHPSWSRRLEDMVDIEAQSARLYTSRPDIDISQSLYAFRAVPGAADMASCIGLHRANGRAPFSERELRIVNIVMSEVSWLHEADLPGEDGTKAAALGARLQTVLTLLIDGQSAKRIAFHLDLSPHTIRGYVKEIYRHFDVGSRSELMRHFMVGDGSDRAN